MNKRKNKWTIQLYRIQPTLRKYQDLLPMEIPKFNKWYNNNYNKSKYPQIHTITQELQLEQTKQPQEQEHRALKIVELLIKVSAPLKDTQPLSQENLPRIMTNTDLLPVVSTYLLSQIIFEL